MKYIINGSSLLIDALKALNDLSGDVMTLLVINDHQQMVGTLTDGDVRRALLSGSSLDSKVYDVMHRDFRFIVSHSTPEDIKHARQLGIALLPLLDDEHHIVEVYNLTKQITRLPIRAVLMAGGRGERMRPMTDTTPKPLLPLGNSTVIDRNVNALRRCGVKNITVTTRYLAEQIENHFNGTEVNCVREETPLGTLGALALVPIFDMGGHTLLMNSDLFTNIDFEALYLQHVSEGNDITIATVSHAVSIPFAVLSTDGPRVVGIDEKPVYTHYANAGIYLISNHLLKDLKPERIDAPDFIANHIEQGAKVGHFPITGTWLDIGTPADYRQAQELLRLLPH